MVHYPDPRQRSSIHDPPHLQFRVQRVGSVLLTPEFWGECTMTAPHFRFMVNEVSGSEVRCASGARHPLPAGRLVVVPPWLDAVAVCGEPTNHFFVRVGVGWFPRGFIRRWWPDPQVADPVGWPTERLKALADVFALGPCGFAETWELRSLVAEVMADLWQRLPNEALLEAEFLGKPMRELRTLLPAIEADPGRPWTVATMAAMVHCSEGHLTRLFQRSLQTSPMAHVIERRLSFAADELMESERTVEAIAERCGFDNRSYFSRMFSRHYGLPPSAFRAQHHRDAIGVPR